jgi:DnaK suppressor protein
MADAGSDNFMHDLELNLMTGEGNVIELIDEAIQRLIDDDYGKCLECGGPINAERLKAIPYAQYCIRCKSLFEKNGREAALPPQLPVGDAV